MIRIVHCDQFRKDAECYPAAKSHITVVGSVDNIFVTTRFEQRGNQAAIGELHLPGAFSRPRVRLSCAERPLRLLRSTQ